MNAQDIVERLGINPLCITPANVHTMSYYMPCLLNEWKAYQAVAEQELRDLKIEREKETARERLRLMELEALGTGPKGAKLRHDDIKFLSKCSPEGFELDKQISAKVAQISQIKGYRNSLRSADVKINSYLGHAREEIALNYRQHAASHNFQVPESIPQMVPIAYDPETGEILEGEEVDYDDGDLDNDDETEDEYEDDTEED